MMKWVLLISMLFSGSLFASESSITFSWSGKQLLGKTETKFIEATFDKDFASLLQSLVNKGFSVEVSMAAEDLFTDSPADCDVTVKIRKDGGGGASLDGKVLKGEVKGNGGVEKEVRVKGPCKEVKEILKEILKD